MRGWIHPLNDNSHSLTGLTRSCVQVGYSLVLERSDLEDVFYYQADGDLPSDTGYDCRWVRTYAPPRFTDTLLGRVDDAVGKSLERAVPVAVERAEIHRRVLRHLRSHLSSTLPGRDEDPEVVLLHRPTLSVLGLGHSPVVISGFGFGFGYFPVLARRVLHLRTLFGSDFSLINGSDSTAAPSETKAVVPSILSANGFPETVVRLDVTDVPKSSASEPDRDHPIDHAAMRFSLTVNVDISHRPFSDTDF